MTDYLSSFDSFQLNQNNARQHDTTIWWENEFLSDWIIYGPVVLFWIVYGLWYRDFAVATLANPRITTGGLCNESKSHILAQAGRAAQEFIAPWRLIQAGKSGTDQACAMIEKGDFIFPLVLKPDVGCKGVGVRLIDTKDELLENINSYEEGTPLIIQEFIEHEGEAGIFYSRLPHSDQGEILSMTFKASPTVIGDGVSTLNELLLAHPRAGKIPHVYTPRLKKRLATVPVKGEIVPLVFTGNHSKGSVFQDATHLVTPTLLRKIDDIMKAFPDFHHGRLDLRFSSLGKLQQGEDFSILEVNGIGSEPIHMWSAGTSLWNMYKIQFRFYGRAFQIGNLIRRQRRYKSAGAFDMLREWRQQTARIKTYPAY
ncbi:hypothetical protein [Kozakia baliensis]|uniref:hypothetical protein n=1 Tax=Kozakia baliensis TaxID=153496 RepID=UPI0008798579|nr:hypothetical protein [Kozakia baliensis]AOX20022.1 hypothetical protein A0U90_06645 [Kozakia baliensis]